MTQQQLLEKWLDITVERLQKNAPVLTEKLKFSIRGELSSAEKVKLIYNLYGMFRDMGVGRGKKLGDAQKMAGKKGRKPNKWYSKQIRREIFALSLLLSNNAGETIMASITKHLPSKIDL